MQGVFSGKGVHTDTKNDECYDGEWLDGLKHGKGVFSYKSSFSVQVNGNVVYPRYKQEGEFFEDSLKCYGIETCDQGSKYEGYFLNGLKDG